MTDTISTTESLYSIIESQKQTFDALLKECRELEMCADLVPQWMDIKSAPKDGSTFLALIDGLPYHAHYDEYGRFIWTMHGNVGEGAAYIVRNIDGRRMLEQTKEAEYNYQKVNYVWRNGFDHKPTHWMPILPAPKEESKNAKD